MKTNKKLLTAILLAGLSSVSIAEENKDIRVSVENNNGVITKNVTVNGVELDEAGIAQLEADGNVKIINLDNIDAEIGDTMTLMNVESMNRTDEDIQVTINTDGDKVTKKVIMNGKELSQDEIAELEASGQLKTLNIDATTLGKGIMNKVMLLNTNENVDANGLHTVEVQTQLGIANDDSATLGFMANIEDDGWHVISVVDGSGAQESGLMAGDIVKFMGDKDLTAGKDNLSDVLDMKDHEEGDMIDLEIERDGKLVYMSIEARKNKSFDMIMKIDQNEIGSTYSKAKIISVDEFSKLSSPNVVKNSFVHLVSSNGKIVNLDDVSVKLPDILGNMNIFITDGESTSKLLGKNHKMSTLSEGLSSYFGTTGGVLVMNVDKNNVFGLKDGDVIKNIDGVEVKSPKDVIKQLLKSEKQEKIKLKIVRHKNNKTLKYNK